MNNAPLTERDLRNLLFISYAYEDQVFAKWLARKLAFYGYGVWIDQIEILGGESWVKEVDVAIKERSFRVLAILSQSSIDKENPRKERTLALQLAKQRKINDFLITLNLDGVQPDWTMSDISWISFRESWADGLRRVLKKLESLNAPRIHDGNPAVAKAALERGASLLLQQPESLTSNWMPIQVPEVLRIYDISNLEEDQAQKAHEVWSHYDLGDGKAAALSVPPSELSRSVRETKEGWHWPSMDFIHKVPTNSIISRLLRNAVHVWLSRAGCCLAEEKSTFYLPDPFRGESIFRFKDVDGSPGYFRVSGRVKLYRPKSPPEEIIHHPSIRVSIRMTEAVGFIVQLRPCVSLFDTAGKQITGKKVGPRTKKVTRGYFNEKWRKRLMAFSQLLMQSASQDKETLLRLGPLMTLSTDWSLDEAPLIASGVSEAEEPVREDVQVSEEEMEDSQDE